MEVGKILLIHVLGKTGPQVQNGSGLQHMQYKTNRTANSISITPKILPEQGRQNMTKRTVPSGLFCTMWEVEKGREQTDSLHGHKQAHHGWKTQEDTRGRESGVSRILPQVLGGHPLQHIYQWKRLHRCWIQVPRCGDDKLLHASIHKQRW